MHYDLDLVRVSSGYVIAFDLDADATSAAMNDADATIAEFAATLTRRLEEDIPPIAEFDVLKTRRGGGG
jgi:hypothetical protein